MKKTFFYKTVTLCLAILLALSDTTPYIAYAEANNTAVTSNNNETINTGNPEDNSEIYNTDNPENPGSNTGNDNLENPGGNTGNNNPENPDGNTGNDNPENPGSNTSNDNTENPGSNTSNDNTEIPSGNTGNDNPENPGGNIGNDNPEIPGGSTGSDNPEPPGGNSGNKKDKKGITIQVGKNKKTIKAINGSFVKKKGTRYFKNQNKKLIKNQFFCKGKNVYYAGSKGEIYLGWNKIKGHYYFFDRKSGKMAFNKKADKIKITKGGIAKETKQNIEIINVYLKAQNVVQMVSKPTYSKAEKLYRCYLWMAKFPYKRYRTMKAAKIKYPNNWDIIFANDIFKNHAGCCASEACAFAYLAKSCGYDNVTICSDTGHAWTDISGKLYDPLFAEARSFKANYNANYSDYRIRPAYTKKL